MSVQNPEQCSVDPDANVSTTSSSAESRADHQESKSNCHVESSSSSTPQSRKFESENGRSAMVSSLDYDLLYHDLQTQECRNPKKRRSKKKRNSCAADCSKDSREENVGLGCKVCKCAGSFAADCAAVCCCCPCAILHLCMLALVKLPFVFAKKTFCYAKKTIPTKKKSAPKEEEVEDEQEKHKGGKRRYSTPPWSCEESPQKSGPLGESPRPKLDSDKIWSELHAAGRMGFGGPLFERN